MSNIEVLIQNGNNLYEPIIEHDITWETERKGMPGKLNLNILKDNIIDFQEGNAIRMKYDGDNVFYGFVFTKKRNKDGLIQVTSYDQLRYFKNKDTYVYSNKTASELVKMLSKDFNLKCGEIEDTKFKIPSRIEEDKPLFDIVQNALDITLENKKEMYVLYDDFGKLTLKNLSSMKLDTLVDGDVVDDFDYSSSIDSNTYNKIKLSKENKDTGKREIYIAQDTSKINKWGVLQHFENIQENTDGKSKVEALLKLYNQKTRTLTVKNVLGDLRVRAGSIVAVLLDLGDINVKNYMIVDKCKHSFAKNTHTMTLNLIGGEFVSSLVGSSGGSSGSSTNNGGSNTTGNGSNSNKPSSEKTESNTNGSNSSKLVSLAKSKLGCKYVWGSAGPNQFDCSGLTSWCYKQIGISIPRTSREQGKAGKYVSRDNLQPGDLIFFNNPISHVGMYVGNDQMVHASNPTRGVVTDNINSSYYKSTYNTSRRFL